MRRDEVKTIFSVYQIWLQEGRDAIMAKRPEQCQSGTNSSPAREVVSARRSCPTILYSLVGTSPPRELIGAELSTALAPAVNASLVVGGAGHPSVYVLLVSLNLTTISLSLTSTLGISS